MKTQAVLLSSVVVVVLALPQFGVAQKATQGKEASKEHVRMQQQKGKHDGGQRYEKGGAKETGFSGDAPQHNGAILDEVLVTLTQKYAPDTVADWQVAISERRALKTVSKPPVSAPEKTAKSKLARGVPVGKPPAPTEQWHAQQGQEIEVLGKAVNAKDDAAIKTALATLLLRYKEKTVAEKNAPPSNFPPVGKHGSKPHKGERYPQGERKMEGKSTIESLVLTVLLEKYASNTLADWTATVATRQALQQQRQTLRTTLKNAGIKPEKLQETAREQLRKEQEAMRALREQNTEKLVNALAAKDIPAIQASLAAHVSAVKVQNTRLQQKVTALQEKANALPTKP
jgi:hypothetical protein